MINLLQAVNDPNLFAPHFRDTNAWAPWWTVAKSIFGLPLNSNDVVLFRQCTGREQAPTATIKEGWFIVGRRGGKSRFVSLVAVFLATFMDWTPYLTPGERGYVTVIAADRRQARVVMNYVRAFLIETPLLRDLVVREAAEEIELSNNIIVEVATCSYRTVRGRTLIAALCDEVAFWADEDGSNPASEVIAALRPAMATIPGSMLLVASSPYAKRGPLWDAVRRHWGKPGQTLVWTAPTWIMNSALSRASGVIAEAYENDPDSAKSEYGAEFRDDISTFIAREVIESLVPPARYELPPLSNVRYTAFVDPSGGSADAMTAAVAHRDREGIAVLDALREWNPPFSPESVVSECAKLLKTYRVRNVIGDRYGGEWPRERFRVHGITYEPSEKPKSDIYRDALPLFNSARCELLDNRRLISQLSALERRTARGGKDSIDHPPGAHDDLANAVAGALVTVGANTPIIVTREAVAAAHAARKRQHPVFFR